MLWMNSSNNLGMNMPIKLNCNLADGLMPAEKVVYIQNADGKVEEVSVSSNNLSGGSLLVSEIGRSEGNVLVELPRESASGRWRVWVKESSIGA